MAPFTPAQRRLFNAAAHDKDIAAEHGMSGREAGKLADEANKLKGEGKEKKPASKSDIEIPMVNAEHDAAVQPLNVIDLSPVWGPKATP
jgi:hypothetical protein